MRCDSLTCERTKLSSTRSVQTLASLVLSVMMAGSAFAQGATPPAAAPATPPKAVPATTPAATPAAAPLAPPASIDEPVLPMQKNPQVKPDPARTREAISATGVRPQAPTSATEQATGVKGGEPVKGGLDPSQNIADPNEAPVMVFEPAIADMGEMIADTPKTVTIKLRNVSSEPIRITKAVPGCGCTTPIWPKDPIPPGGTGDCEITLKPGATQGVTLNKKVTFQIENHNPVILTVEGKVVAYVLMTPSMLDSPTDASPSPAPGSPITLESTENVAFKITEISPPVVKNPPTEAATKHVLTVDWANWEEAGRSPKILIKTDNPKAPTMTMLVKRSISKNAPMAPEGPKQPTGPGTTDLINAIRDGDLAKVSSIIASGADVNEHDKAGSRTALHWAAKSGNRAALEALIAAKADLNAQDRQGRTPLWSAVEGDLETVSYLLEKGSNVNARDLIKSTPLLWASGFGKPETVAFLLSKGADVKAVDDNGWTALIWAAGLGQPMTVDILVKSGADLNAVDKTGGDTPLLRGSRTGKKESIEILLKAGANVTVKNNLGQTALHLAAMSGSPEKVELLLAAQADPAALDLKGWAPIDHAMNRTTGDKTRLIEVLKPVSPAPAVVTPAVSK